MKNILLSILTLGFLGQVALAQDISPKTDITAIISKWNMADITPKGVTLEYNCTTCVPTLDNQPTSKPASITLDGGIVITLMFDDMTPGSCSIIEGNCVSVTGCTTTGFMTITTPINIIFDGILITAPGGRFSIDVPPILNCGLNYTISIYNSSGTRLLGKVIYQCSSCV